MTGMTGRLRLVVGLDEDGRCRLREQFGSQLHRVLRLIPGEAPHQGLIYLLNPSGGIAQGDRLEAEVRVESGAHAIVTSPSATKVYRMDRGEASSTTRFFVQAGGFLEHLPELLIPQEGSRFVEDVELALEPGAKALAWELVAPGRQARGESLRYDRLSLRFRVSHGGRVIVRERMDLVPSENLGGSVVLGPYSYYGVLLAVGEGADQAIEALRERVQNPREVFAGVTRLPAPGLMVKALAPDSKSLLRLFGEARETVIPLLAGRPALGLRKT
jgi:urease accessory protein